MTTLYCLWWDNGKWYEDKYEELVGIYSTKALAEAAIPKDMDTGRREHDPDGRHEIHERELDKDP